MDAPVWEERVPAELRDEAVCVPVTLETMDEAVWIPVDELMVEAPV